MLVPGLAADNSLAGCRIRPLVVAGDPRTGVISGGTRSPEGSAVRMGLTSRLATFQARGLNPSTALVTLPASLAAHP